VEVEVGCLYPDTSDGDSEVVTRLEHRHRLDTGSTPARHRLDTGSTPVRHRLDIGKVRFGFLEQRVDMSD
jgi:hypothetical protein